MGKLWQLKDNLNKQVEAFETKNDLLLDQFLVGSDVVGTLAHGKMLYKIGILNLKELKQLEKGLNEIIRLEKEGKFKLQPGDEDVHTKIENYLSQKYPDLGRKIHTGRSRNDQVLSAIRLYTKEKLNEIRKEVVNAYRAFSDYSRKYKKIEMPGYTHMQKAMPSTVGLWLGSFRDSFSDDLTQLKSVFNLINQSPLGSGAAYGIPFDVKREYTAKLLGFAKVQENSLYCQSSRGKIEAAVLSTLISVLLTINKFASDVLLFTTSEFGFFEVDKSLTSGSSIMPQKKNVDLAELLRSKVHLVLGYYTALVSLTANLPSGYNRDLQDTKKPLFESLEITIDSLKMCQIMLNGLKPIKKALDKAMTAELYAASEALLMAKKGIPFRKAYMSVKKRWR